MKRTTCDLNTRPVEQKHLATLGLLQMTQSDYDLVDIVDTVAGNPRVQGRSWEKPTR